MSQGALWSQDEVRLQAEQARGQLDIFEALSDPDPDDQQPAATERHADDRNER